MTATAAATANAAKAKKAKAKARAAARAEPIEPTPAEHTVDYANTELASEVARINRRLDEVFKTNYPAGTSATIGQIKIGIYAFFDYENHPIYVGQTREQMSTRIRRHLTGMRSDSVAKFVLDPFEVRTVKVWPLPKLLEDFPVTDGKRSKEAEADLRKALNGYEAAIYNLVLKDGGALLNEGPMSSEAHDPDDLPEAETFQIIPLSVFKDRSHVDIRIARRAQTIANLARHISERDASDGLRRALNTQAERLSDLSTRRLQGLHIKPGGLPFVTDDTEDSATES